MGKSKFPGKPSRLVNKKRVSVLSPAGLTLSDEDNQENNGQQAQQQQQGAGNSASAAAVAASSSTVGTSPASTASSSTVSMRTSEKLSSFAQRKEQQQQHTASSVTGAGTKGSKATVTSNGHNSAAGTTVSSSQSSSAENGTGRRNGSDKHTAGAAVSKDGASENNETENGGDDNDEPDHNNGDENEDDEEEEDDDEEDDDDDDDEEEDDDDEEEEEEEDDDDDEEEEDNEELAVGGVGAGDESTATGSSSSTATATTSSNAVSSTAAATTSTPVTISGTSEVRSAVGNGQQQSSSQQQHQSTMQSSSSSARSEKLPATGNGFEMKPSTLTSALARRCPPGVASSGRVSRQQSPSCEPAASLSAASSESANSNPSTAGSSATTVRVHKAEASIEQATTIADGTGSSAEATSAAATAAAAATLMGTKPPNAALATPAAASVAPVKKKSVTFHTTLETTDENIVKKVYNPDTVPLPSIIKKECLARPIRLKKSFNRKMKKRLQRAVAAAAAASAAASASASVSGGSKAMECLVRPSRLTEIVLKSSSKSSSAVGGTLERNSGSVGGLGFGLKASEGAKSGVSFGATGEPTTAQSAPASTTDGGDMVGRNLESGGTQFGDKRFILPKRSVHSSRVIKPNKRFLDEFELEIKKKNKNLAAAAAIAAAAAAAGTGSGVPGAGVSSNSSAAGAGFGVLGPAGEAGGSNGTGNEGDCATGDDTRRKKDKKKGDESTGSIGSSEKTSTNAHPHNDQRPDRSPPGDRTLMTPISINPFAKTSLTDGPLVPGTNKCSGSKLVKPSQLSPAIASSTLGSSTTSTTNLAAAASIFGKGILRQPRLQFATSLLNSAGSSNHIGASNGGTTLSSITSSNSNSQSVPSSTPNSASATGSATGATLGTGNGAVEGLFTMHLKAKAKLDSAKLFSAALGVGNGSSTVQTGSNNSASAACCICSIPVNTRYYAQPTKKYGVSCCDVCRKFISKMVKKLATGSLISPSQSGAGAEVTMLKCKNEGKCLITPPSLLVRPDSVKTRHIFKERCHACWLRKCLGSFQLPPVLKIRLGQTLPLTMRTFEPPVSGSPGCVGTLKKDPSTEGNLFANSIAEHGPTNGTSRILWNSGDKKSGSLAEGFNKSFNPFLALHINPLSQNNNTFGSVPQIKLNLGGNERSSIMAASPSSSSGASSSGGKSPSASKEDIFTSNEPRKEKDSVMKVEDPSTVVPASARKDIKEEQDNSPVKPPRTRSKSEANSSTHHQVDATASVETKTENVATSTSSNASQSTTPSAGPQTATGANQTAATDKRQRIDLKGPRVKHVCRSASIVLGQPLATFPEDGSVGSPSGGALENIETPPSDSAAEPAEDLPLMDRERRASKSTGKQDCSDCIDPTVALSPPATPDEDTAEEVRDTPTKADRFDPDTSGSTEKELVIDEDKLPEVEDDKDALPCREETKACELKENILEANAANSMPTEVVIPVKEEQVKPLTVAIPATTAVKKLEDNIEKPATRKTTSSFRPQASRHFGIGAMSKGPSNISGRKQQQSAVSSSLVALGNRNVMSSSAAGATGALGSSANFRTLQDIPMISIDFWENYDPAEVSRTGFGLILSESMPVRALCFLCGSAGLESMLFCVCCCEPYHQYCVKDEYNLRTGTGTGLDDTGNMSLLDVTLGASPQQQQEQLLIARYNWMCPRCTVCFSCNMATGAKVKCQKCSKHYHTTCLGTSKRLHGADRPLICAACLRCKSCGTTNVTKFIGNLPMCTPCFRLRQKGNYCPLCQKCYEDNDFDLKMMECGDCRRWVHARCEGLTDEQYNMLSVLPENIEFICKKCAKHSDSTAHLWRDAVAAEFKAGLLSVVKLLSKSRQACALLKLSPRKKSPNCTCGAAAGSIINGKNISFFGGPFASGADSITASGFSSSAAGSASKKPKLDEDSIYDFSSENSCGSSSGNSNTGTGYAVVPVAGSGNSFNKCYCSARFAPGKGSPSGGDISLVDIKQKINANEYYSLQDFHYDMNTLLQMVGSEELTVAYKEFLSETFPWFQNETKACTDALEEAMCGEVDQTAGLDRYSSCAGSGGLGGRGGLQHGSNNMSGSAYEAIGATLDQKVPQIDIPLEELTDYFHETAEELLDTRSCMLCKQHGEGMTLHESRLLYCGQNNWVHTNCALWSAEVFEEIDGSLQNVHSAASRGRLIKCCHCGVKGATVGCNVKNCGEHYHFPCARRIGCVFMLDKTVYCTAHAGDAKKKRCPEERNFEIARSVYVELDRRKKRFVEPGRVQFMIGSLNVRHLGHIVPTFSDHADVLIPTDFECTRLYWSAKEPWKIVSYRIKTSIQSTNYGYGTDLGKNFTVDHSSNSSTVQWGLTQIARWHTSLQYADSPEDADVDPLESEALQQHLLSSMSSTATTMTTTTTTQLLASSRSGASKQQQNLHQQLQSLCESNAVCNTGEDTNDEEPQNTNDLLPPEIKDAIFEDLPHDILDGISMLDILPKLMTYEDLLAMDLKTDATFNVDILKDPGSMLQVHGNGAGSSSSNSVATTANMGNSSKPEDHSGMDVDDMDSLNEAIGGAVGSELSNDSWTKTIGAPGVEDALLSGMAKPPSSNGTNVMQHRELKRSKSDILEVIAAVGQQQPRGQRSGSFSWSTKQLESTAAVVAKRRKIAKNNIKLSDVLSLGRIKEDVTFGGPMSTTTTTTTTTALATTTASSTTIVMEDRLKAVQEEFSWSSMKKSTSTSDGASDSGNVFEKLKISQLDGVDDICLDGTVGEMKIYSSRSMIEAPVKCDRCQATYRNQESYQRHLSSCEVLSTSESESETRSPRLLSPEQQQQQQQQQQQIITGQIAGTAGNTFILPQATSQPQTITTDIYGNTTGYLTASSQPTGHPQTISVLQTGQTINLNGNQAILSNLPTSMPITINQLSSNGIPIQTSATGAQQIPIQGTLQAGSVGLQNLGGNMIISTPNGQGQLFATTNQFSNAAFQQQAQQQQQQQVLQDNNAQQYLQNKQRFIQPAPATSSITLPHSLASGTGPMTTTTLSTAQALGGVFSQQPQIISIGPNGQPQLMTLAAPQQQQTILQSGATQPMTMQPSAKKIVYTTASPKKVVTKLPQQHHQQQGSLKTKRTVTSNGVSKGSMQMQKAKQQQQHHHQQQQEQTMTLHPTSAMIGGQAAGQLQTTIAAQPQQQQQQQQQQIQLINASYPLIRSAATPAAPQQAPGNIIFQTQSPANQPILVQQVGGNQISYLADQGTLTHNPVQYQLAPANMLTQNGFAMATTGTDAGTLAAATANNILIPNGTGGYSLIPASALQIATQPQVIGTIVQPQAATIQCGMMATEQMVLGSAAAATAQPTLEMMVTDPASGCMYLTSPSMYYGLETIVQNTVMSSQQFVSATAMQGYVVLNNDATGQPMQIGTSTPSVVSQAPAPVQMQTSTAGQTIFQQAPLQQTAVVSSAQGTLPATLQPTHQPLGTSTIQQQQQQQHQQQQQQMWKIEASSPSAITIQPSINTIATSSSSSTTSIVTPLKPTMKTIIPKSQPQLVNKVMPNTAMKVLSAGAEQLTTSTGIVSASQQHKSAAAYQSIVSSSVYTTATAMTTSTKVSNVIKPITKTTNYTKPKIVAKPVKQKTSTSLLSPPPSTPPPTSIYQLSQQQPQSLMISTQPVPQQQLLQNSITLIPATNNIASVNNSSQLVPIKPNVNANGLQTITANQLTVSAIKQPSMVIEKLPHQSPQLQASPVVSSTSATPVTNGITLSNGPMMIIQPTNATLKKPAHVTSQGAHMKKQKTMLPMNHNQNQMMSYATPQQQTQQAQAQQQQPYQQLMSVSTAQQQQQLAGLPQQQQQQLQSQPITITQSKGALSKKSTSAGQITLSLANTGSSNGSGPIPVSMPASTITITPTQPASITLPTAPYPMPLYSNIPTNVVNPIQQQTNQSINQNSNSSSTVQNRPTNRVLPMQASVMQQKNSDVSQTPPPPPLKMLQQQCSEKLDEFSIIPNNHQVSSPYGVSTPGASPNDVDRMKMAGNEKLLSSSKSNNRLEIEIKPIEITPLTSAMMTPTTTNGSCTPSPLPPPSSHQQESVPSPAATDQSAMMMEIEEQQQQQQQQANQQQLQPSFQFSLSFDGNGTLIPLGGGPLDQQQQQNGPLTMAAQIEIKPILSSPASGANDELQSPQPTLMSHDSIEDDRDTETQRIDELKHSLEAETQEMLAEGHDTSLCGESGAGGSSGAASPSLNDGESDSPEIKDKISEILDNLEQQTNQEAEMQMDAFDSLRQSKDLQEDQRHHRTLETVADCADETERIVAELNEEFNSAATSPSLTTAATTVPMMTLDEMQSSDNLANQQSLLTIANSMFDSKKESDAAVCFRDTVQRSNFAGGNGTGNDLIDSSLLQSGDAESVLFGKIRQPEPSPLSQPSPTEHHHQLQLDEELQQYTVQPSPPAATPKAQSVPRSTSPKLLYEIQSQDGFTYKSTSIAEIWDKLFEAVQIARRAHGLTALPEGQLKEMAGVQMLGLKTNAIRYLLEQLPGVEKCTQYSPLYHKKQAGMGGSGVGGAGGGHGMGMNGGFASHGSSEYADYFEDLQENPHGTARCEPYSSRSEYDMFSWLASRHRKQPMPIVAQNIDDTIIPRRGSGSNLPMAMRYRTLKESSKESVGVYRSHIHGRGLFCNRDIEAGEMVIEYAGELIRSTLTDKRERYYDSRGIGCYMFKIDENFVVDATMRGNAARFINHSCEPNCYSKVVDILGHKHIIIFALRRIVQGEELTYDYKFPFEDVKIPCSCGSKKCRKYLN
ncbi:histone-lysine N-methyltransferase trithorax isoform X2 [Anopheles stephensi]|uniref:histone-lysine N-methyltransferase trithorax isoform X2 n=1 Tax=Anopheles stephensi TaxID=30069 RepID=UPI001658C0A2|nr:histone-lysine N-methyltransferase trithorax isoform X2 [Anopheles stephensi]